MQWLRYWVFVEIKAPPKIGIAPCNDAPTTYFCVLRDIELTMADTSIVIYVTDHADQPIATTRATANLEVSTSGKKILVYLTPAAEDTFKAEWPGAVSADLAAQLTVKFPNEKAQKAKFAPFAKRK